MVSPSDTDPEFGLPVDGRTPDIKMGNGNEPDTKTIVGGESITDGNLPKTEVPIGSSIGKYQIRSQLGVGGMGAVYLAFDPLIEREVAIKLLNQEVGSSTVDLQRFLQEARAIGRLNHPNVVSIFDIDQWNDQYYLVMELLSGGSLAQVVSDRGPLPWQDACQMIAQAAAGLAAAHEAGMLHRDIKPENLMQSASGIVKVVDFGLSKLIDSANDTRTAVTRQGQILGTPHYMSPEQFDVAELDSRTDIYSLGASLFRLLTARFPFQECVTIVQTMMAHSNKPVPRASEFQSQVPAECDRIISRAMAKHPSDRYQNAHEMADDLLSAIQGHRPNHPLVSSPAHLLQAASLTHRSTTTLTADAIRPLSSVVIVQPSKMLAAMMKDSVVRAGVIQVDVVASKELAFVAIQKRIPDLLITAMQLPDGLGLDLISEICRQSPLNRTCVVLNSSDSSIEDLIGAGSAACRILSPKTARPDEILRLVHAAGPAAISQGVISTAIDPMGLRLMIMTDLSKIPDVLADAIRLLGLLDVVICGATDVASIPNDDLPTVILRLRLAKRTAGDDTVYAKVPEWLSGSRHLLAEVQVDGNSLVLRAVSRMGVTASVFRLLDANRLTYLLQACR